jgi:hypothetical protein
VQILHLAARTSEQEVRIALELLNEAGATPSLEQIRALVQPPALPPLPPVCVDLRPYDQLLEVAHG